MMKRLMLIAVFVATLAGCAAQQRQADRKAQWDAAVAELQRQNNAALAGEQSFAQAYQKMSEYGYSLKSPIFQEAIVSGAAIMMPFARARDAGKISAEQMSDAQMYVGAQVTSWVNRQITLEEDTIQRREAAESARLSQALSAIYMSQVIANPPRSSVNCMGQQVGNFYNVNCR